MEEQRKNYNKTSGKQLRSLNKRPNMGEHNSKEKIPDDLNPFQEAIFINLIDRY